MMEDDTIGTWSEYQRLVLGELKNIKQDVSQLSTEIKQEINTLREAINSNTTEHMTMREEIAALKVKSGMWGAISGALVVLIAIAVELIKQ